MNDLINESSILPMKSKFIKSQSTSLLFLQTNVTFFMNDLIDESHIIGMNIELFKWHNRWGSYS
jgi:hypothetical protein